MAETNERNEVNEETGAQVARRSGRGNILITIGVVLVCAALLLTAYNLWDAHRAGEEANEILTELPAMDDSSSSSSASEAAWDKDAEMPVKTINGYAYIGRISIPSLNIDLPVMAEWDYTRLRVSPCRYTGSYWSDDMVICGHNYYSHFSPIKWVDVGADVYFTNVDGYTIHYVVSNRETVQPTSVDQMIDNDKNSTVTSDWDLTLFTCNTGGQTRCAVRCIRTSGPGK